MALNLAALDALRAYQAEGEPDFVTELIDAYLADSPPRLGALQATLAAGDLAAFSKAAHGLKGSSSNLGAEVLARLCLKAEMAGKTLDTATAHAVMPELMQEYAAVAEELKSLRRP